MIKTIMISMLMTLVLGGCTTAAILAGGTASGLGVAHDRRTTGTIVDDNITTRRITSALSDNRLFDGSHINVTVFNQIVLVTGEVPIGQAKTQLVPYLRSQVGLLGPIYNELLIGAPTSFMVRVNDSAITTKVKFNLFGSDDAGLTKFDPTRVKVVTENSVVYLMGIVTRTEGNFAAQKASEISGVTRVVKVFQYIAEAPESNAGFQPQQQQGQINIPQ